MKALAEIERHCPSVILLDWMLPEISGVEICKLVRSKPDIKNIPIIMLTAKGEEEDKIKGLSAGADDYVTKPFSVPELMARVKANLRRAPELIKQKEFVFEDIRMDLVEKKVFRGENYIHLGPTEFRLLKMLMETPGKVFSREILLKTVWGDNIYVESRTVDVHIRRLRIWSGLYPHGSRHGLFHRHQALRRRRRASTGDGRGRIKNKSPQSGVQSSAFLVCFCENSCFLSKIMLRLNQIHIFI